MKTVTGLEAYFTRFAADIIGNHQSFESPYGEKQILYADWTATGRACRSIEQTLQDNVLPFVANTHTGSTVTGKTMSSAYEQAKAIIKHHCNANQADSLLFCGSGMTHAVNKLQRLLGLRLPERIGDYRPANGLQTFDTLLQPVVFASHMEHHSNHTSWLETIATVEIIRPAADGNVDLTHLASLLRQYKNRKFKIAAVTACSNVTGMETPYHAIAKTMHACGGWCFVDFACSAPYLAIDMHPAEREAQLDAIYFSGHKFLGGPGSPGVLILNNRLYQNAIPDQPGGGTVFYSNPWDKHAFVSDIEQREDGGTPPFLGAIKLAMCIRLKEAMGVTRIGLREQEIIEQVTTRLSCMRGLELLGNPHLRRLPIFSFTVTGAHHQLFVQLLNDRFGVQARGGCSCAGTYGHFLLDVGKDKSAHIFESLRKGDSLCKPGWVRISLHPTMADKNISDVVDAVEQVILNYLEWARDYTYDSTRQEFVYKFPHTQPPVSTNGWFD